MPAKKPQKLYDRIRQILESARATAARSVNTAQVVAHWLIGQEIVEEEQKGAKRADYGKQLLEGLSKQLVAEFKGGYSVQNLRFIRQFYLTYPQLLDTAAIRYALRSEFKDLTTMVPVVAPSDWQPGSLHPNLSWTHYRTLLRVSRSEARAFYEIEALKNNWSARELERQINTMLYERLALSKDKKGLLRLATKGQEIQKSGDVFKDPVVIEFLLDREALKWFRPAKGQFQIFYRCGGDHLEYQPDFVAETTDSIYMLEVKARGEMEDAEVQTKKDAAVKWCNHATDHALKNGGKSWQYLLIPHDVIAENMTVAGLVSSFLAP